MPLPVLADNAPENAKECILSCVSPSTDSEPRSNFRVLPVIRDLTLLVILLAEYAAPKDAAAPVLFTAAIPPANAKRSITSLAPSVTSPLASPMPARP